MPKQYHDLKTLVSPEEGGYQSGLNRHGSGLSFPQTSRSSRLLYSLFALCAILLTILIIVVTVNSSNMKTTQKKQDENLSNFSLSVQSHFEAVRSDEGSMQEKIKSLETALKKLASDKTVELVQESLKEMKTNVDRLRCDFKKLSSNDSKLWCCPEDWEEFSGSCYLFVRKGKTWPDSKKLCELKNANLVVINTASEQEFLQKKTIPEYTWIGLTDADGKWIWVDGTSYESALQHWIPGQPDEYYGHGLGGGEDCAHLHHNGKWNDDHCSRLYQAICEMKI